ASLLAIRSRGVPAEAGRGSQVRAIGEGLAYVRTQPRIGAMLGFTALTAAFVFPNLAIMMPVYARDVLRVGVTEMGMLMGVSGLGALVGSMALLGVPREQQVQRIGHG